MRTATTTTDPAAGERVVLDPSQIGFFINAHAEDLWSFFVARDGQKELEVLEMGNLNTVNVGDLAVRLTKKIEKNVVDPELRTWIMPAFSTTTPSDKVIAAVLMMGALQKYFSYKMSLRCGIPSVMLLGERKVWATMVNKLDKIPQLVKEPAKLAQLLRPVLERFIASFDSPSSSKIRDFWGKCAHQITGGRGPTYLSGWITAFCFWDAEGKPLYSGERLGCELDRVKFHRIDIQDIPARLAFVPVTVDDKEIVYNTEMVAGMVGIGARSSGKPVDRAGNHICYPLSLPGRSEGQVPGENDYEEPVLDSI